MGLFDDEQRPRVLGNKKGPRWRAEVAFGFAKGDVANLDDAEEAFFKKAAKLILGFTDAQIEAEVAASRMSKGLVSAWERRVKKPGGPALRLLTVVQKKELQAIA